MSNDDPKNQRRPTLEQWRQMAELDILPCSKLFKHFGIDLSGEVACKTPETGESQPADQLPH